MKFRPKRSQKKKFWTKQKIITMAIGSIIILLMVTSALNMYEGDDESVVEYKDYKFSYTYEGWQANIDGKKVYLSYPPEELLDIEMEFIDVTQMDQLTKIYYSINPSQDPQAAIYAFDRYFDFGGMQVPACFEDVEGCETMPLKTCEDIDMGIGVIIFNQTEEYGMFMDTNCVIIQGPNLLKAVDRVILNYI
ncbi:MAG: hypothetical protein ABIF40_05345 [archaeon]